MNLCGNNLTSAFKESLRVFIGYCSMTIGPLLIIRYQLMGLVSSGKDGGWLQWNIKPIRDGILKSINGWLMIMPLVLLIGWFIQLSIHLPGDAATENIVSCILYASIIYFQ